MENKVADEGTELALLQNKEENIEGLPEGTPEAGATAEINLEDLPPVPMSDFEKMAKFLCQIPPDWEAAEKHGKASLVHKKVFDPADKE